ncbi:hypothetical protein ACFWIQ_19395 [Kitasatospora sp. NPDC127059]|uniref:tetratricopeptide repeat protein n=1 Tax=Kitasatospora sp. NPDC127059 TaxID=3347120 RepID=UPI00366A34E1
MTDPTTSTPDGARGSGFGSGDSGVAFYGPAALQYGNNNTQHNTFLPPRARPDVPRDEPRPLARWTPAQLGVHPAIPGAASGLGVGAFVLPTYIERDHDRSLRQHLKDAAACLETVLVVVRGESCTGKTRTAVEAVRTCLADWDLVFPKTVDSLLAVLGSAALKPRTVLWLDEAQSFLTGPEGETAAAALRTRLEGPGPVVIIATLWPAYYRDLTVTPTPSSADRHPNVRALLGPVRVVDVPGTFTDQALHDLRSRTTHGTPLDAADRFGPGGTITQTLAAGPQLVDHYEQAAHPHGPYGKAVITAAMDARRLGHTSPLPAALLEAAAPGYLTEELRAAADPDTWFVDALAYARAKVKGVVAALGDIARPTGMGSLPDVYALADYLDQYSRATRRYRFPPGSFWTAVEQHAATALDLHALADAAVWRGRYRLGATLYQRAAEAGHARSLVDLALLQDKAGDVQGAERLAQRAAEGGHTSALLRLARTRFISDPVGSQRLAQRAADAGNTEALVMLARRRELEGDAEAAELLILRAAEAGHPNELMSLVRSRMEFGDSEGAERLLQRAVDTGHTAALTPLGTVRYQAGDRAGAERLWLQAAEDGHPGAMSLLADMREEEGDAEEAELLLLRAVGIQRSNLVQLRAWKREQAGDLVGAERLLQRAADAGHTDVLQDLARLRERAGDPAGAERLLQQAADAGHTSVLKNLARLRERAGDLAGAQRLRAADPGRHGELSRQVELLDRAGDSEGAERLLQQASDTPNSVLLRLARLRMRAGDRAGAERLRLRAIANNHADGEAWGDLARMREAAGDLEGAERILLQAAAITAPYVLLDLARSRKLAGNWAGAERLLLRAADAGEHGAMAELEWLREAAGDRVGAERVRRFGLEADGSTAVEWSREFH